MKSSLYVLVAVFSCLIAPKAFASSAAGTETLVGIVGSDFVLLGADSSVSQSISLTASNLDKIAVLVDPFPEGRPKEQNCNHQQCIAAAAAGDAADTDRLIGILTAHAAIREFEASVGCDVDLVDCSIVANKEVRPTTITPTSIASSPIGLSVQDVAYLARSQISDQLRSREPLKVCLLVAGMMVDVDSRRSARNSQIVLPTTTRSFASERLQQQVRGASSAFTKTTESETTTSEAAEVSERSSDAKAAPRLFWLDEYGSIQSLKYGAHGFGSNFILSILDQGYHPNMGQQEAVVLMQDCFEQLRKRYVINSPQAPCIKCIDKEGCRLVR